MLRDNQRWRQEHAQWQNEVHHWKKESSRLEAVLYRLERTIPAYGDKLKDHAFAMLQHDLRLRHHERKLIESMNNGTPKEAKQDLLKAEHQEQAEHHRRVQQQHEDMKKVHKEAMEETRGLTRLADDIAQQIRD